MLLFLERGYQATSIEEISAAAGVSRRTFFRYFPTKDAAFFAAEDARYDAFVAALDEARATPNVWHAVSDAMHRRVASYAADRRGTVAWYTVLGAVPALHAQHMAHELRWEASIRDAFLTEGLEAFEASLCAGATVGVIRAVLADWVAEGGRGDLVVGWRRATDWLSRAAS